LGVKPLYYTEIENGFLFSSELKSLLRCKDVSRTLDFRALYQNLAYLRIPAPLTTVKGIFKLPLDKAIFLKDGKLIKEWTYYDLPNSG
jgi:asparagine synthase (glutamine-hydrolysing)